MGAGAFSGDFTTNLAWQCRAFSRALRIEKLKAPLFRGPEGAGATNDWRINIERKSATNKEEIIKQSKLSTLFKPSFYSLIVYFYITHPNEITTLTVLKIKIKKLCLTSRFETDNISSVELLLRHNE